jgi:cbb3-type cytochrome oxidase cytochrome c subunit
VRGAIVFAESGCLTCHRYLGDGVTNLRAPDLTAAGDEQRGLTWQIRHLRCPQCVVRTSPMPRFAPLGPTHLRRLAIFLEASHGAPE